MALKLRKGRSRGTVSVGSAGSVAATEVGCMVDRGHRGQPEVRVRFSCPADLTVSPLLPGSKKKQETVANIITFFVRTQ